MKTMMISVALFALWSCSAAPEPRGAAESGVAVQAGDWMELADMDGAEHDLRDALSAGREVALVYWQTWCAPCRREAPHLAAAARRLEGQVDFYGVVSGPAGGVDEGEVAALAESWSLPYPQVRDRDGSLARRFGVTGTPTIVVLEPSGRVAYNGHSLPESW